MIKPLNNNVIIQRIQAEDKTQSGIVITPVQRKEPNTATVVALPEQAMELSVGDTVVFNKHKVTEITVDSETYLSIDYQDIFAKIEKEI